MINKNTLFPRRQFLSVLPVFTLGSHLWISNRHPDIQEKRTRTFGQPFSPDEKIIIEKSVMAKDIDNFAGKGYSCAESILFVSLRYLDKPEEWGNAAAAFGGGLGKGDLCGLLTGSMMAIGIAGGKMYENRLIMKKEVRDASNTFWNWWESWAPIHCQDLRNEYEGSEAYLRMCKRVAVKLEQFMGPEVQ